ncbi:MAG: hypothetical protein QM647_14110 [Asticcacaulis sp.]|uniref:hypothetical protein n=1 Tax=Asticcacaulis sp. TaxID=1872648 RepID=UPI0039E5611A
MKVATILTAGLAMATLLAGGMARAEAPAVIPLSPYLGVIWSFQAEVKGKPETFLLDTAGGITVITPATATEMGCEPWGQMTGFRMRGDRMDLKRCDDLTFGAAGETLKTPTAGVWDFANVLPKDAPPLAGSIALDSFAGKVVTLDLGHSQLVIETPESLKARIAGAREVTVRLNREMAGLSLTPFVAVKTTKGNVWLELDSGSDAPVVVGSHNAELLGLSADSPQPQSLQADIDGGVPLKTEAARTMPLIIDGNIGAPVLAQWVVTLDLANARAWIVPAKP